MPDTGHPLVIPCLRCKKTFTIDVLGGAVVTVSPLGYCSAECYLAALRTKEATSRAGRRRMAPAAD